MSRDDLIDSFRIARDPAASAQDGRPEPRFGAVPLQVDLDAARLETALTTVQPQAPSQLRRRTLPVGMLVSLAVHLSPLLLLLSWASAPAEVVTPIPIELVLEQPPPPPKPEPKPEQKAEKPPPPPPLGRLASADMGEPVKEEQPPASSPDQPSSQPHEEKVAAVPPPPPDLVSALPKPVSPPDPLTAEPPREPTPPAKPAAKPAVVTPHPPKPQPARPRVIPGPDATRDEYLAYIAGLINRHKDLIAPGALGGRRGVAVISITVLGNGTIARIAVKRGSGYPDIDARIEQMITAVGRFPPLPQWIQAPSVMLDFHRVFPDPTL